MHRNIVPGIWLTLATDLANGVLYRPVVSEGGYGGTRYFPLHFVAIAGFMRAGAAPGTAGFLAALLSVAVLGSGVFVAARRCGMPPAIAALLATVSFSQYFVVQTLFELRSDVLAAGLNLWGVALVIPAWTRKGTQVNIGGAALLFALAAATKVTSLALPAAVGAAFWISGRQRNAIRLTALVGAGALTAFGATQLLSGGRALENWRACLFAGMGLEGTLSLFLKGTFLNRFFFSHFLSVLLVLVLIVLVAAPLLRTEADARERSSLWPLVVPLFLAATASLLVTLSSPGTDASNQAIEWIQVSLVVFAASVWGASRLARPISTALAVLAIWAAAQNVVQVYTFVERDPEAALRAAVRQQVVDRIAQTPGAVPSESALWPTLARRHAIILDPFMFRILSKNLPNFESQLIARIDAKAFSLVLLQRDPQSVRGRLFFETVDLGWPVVERILANYRLESNPASDVFLYVPR